MQKRNAKTIAIVIGIIIVLGVLFALPKYLDPNRKTIQAWKDAGVVCLVNGHTNLAQHFHPWLTIIVDGTPEEVPANIGNIPTCMAEIHTHGANGEVHVESFKGEKEFTLPQLFAVWGRPLEREGYELKASVDEEEVEDVAGVTLKDRQKIHLEYSEAKN